MHNTVVIGASSGVGATIAMRRAGLGERVIAVARRADRLASLAGHHPNIVAQAFDIANVGNVRTLFSDIVKEFGQVQHVVYCAGMQYIAPVRGTNLERVDELFRVNFTGALATLQAFSSKKINTGGGSAFVAISSVAADRPEAGIVSYGASKAALNALIKGAAVECAPVRVNAIAPGFMKTEMTSGQAHVYSESFVQELERRTPLGLVSPEMVADLANFLLSEQHASHLTGQVITLDGGATLK